MNAGKFIVLEGGEGAGKSTQARMLADVLRARGIDVVLTREPGGTTGAEAIRGLLLNPEGEGWGVRAEALLFAAARSDHVERLIRPALSQGRWVVCDRFLDSSRAYQGAGGLDDTAILTLHDVGSGGLLPDLTILITVSPGVASQRLAIRDQGRSDRIGGRSSDYHAQVHAALTAFAKEQPERFALVDGDGTVEATHALVLNAIGSIPA